MIKRTGAPLWLHKFIVPQTRLNHTNLSTETEESACWSSLKLIKFLLTEQLTELRDFLREAGDFLCLALSLLLLTGADEAVWTWNMLALKTIYQPLNSNSVCLSVCRSSLSPVLFHLKLVPSSSQRAAQTAAGSHTWGSGGHRDWTLSIISLWADVSITLHIELFSLSVLECTSFLLLWMWHKFTV